MKKFNKLFFITLLYFISISITCADEPIAYVDVDFIIKNSNIGKKTLNAINNLNNENIKTLKKKEQILKDLEIQIASKQNIISKEAFENEVLIFKEKVDLFERGHKYIEVELDNTFPKFIVSNKEIFKNWIL